ncbi:YLP motif-containing protein 1 isoform X2 [Hoplias malabaricus]|uniref:YLP motif-containing protein 1 isoform X2 n=1 Tax=Hoplias malabaricus TaxID=27720 RepID=UPI0034628C71
MYPMWGGYCGAPQQPPPPPFGSRVPGSGPPRPPFGAPPAPSHSNFSSLQEQHLQQMQQLQQLHQRQLQSVLQHSGSPGPGPAGYGSGGFGSGSPGFGSTSAGSTVYPQGPGSVPPGSAAISDPLKHSAGDSAHKVGPSVPEEPPQQSEFSSMSLQEQQEYWYKQHLQNLQRLKNEKSKQNPNGVPAKGSDQTAAPPPPTEPPNTAPPPPPPPKEEPPPPPPPEDSKGSVGCDSGDPVEAARLQQLQAAAAHWQQVQQQRAGFQYQALMQEHAQLQQVLQQYQQVIQQPAHLQTMPVDMQLKHYEMQQQQFAPVLQEWDRHFKLWLEQFQVYPHKDQLQDYEGQWRQWQEQMNSTSAHLHERVSTLRAMKQQYNVSDPYGNMIGTYGPPRPPAPDTHPPKTGPVGPSVPQNNMDLTGGPCPQGPQSMPGSNLPEGPSEPYKPGPQGPGPRQPGPHGRFEGPRGPRFEGPRGPRFEPPPQRFSGPPRFDAAQNLAMPPRHNLVRPGVPGRFDNPPRQSPPSRFERPPGPPQQPFIGPQCKPGLLEQNQSKPPQTKPTEPKASPSLSVQTSQSENKTPQDKIQKNNSADTNKSMTDDIMDSDDGFFLQSEPIPQTHTDVPKKPEEPSKQTPKEELKKDIPKTPLSTSSPVPPKPPVSTANKIPQSTSSELSESISASNGTQQQTRPPLQAPLKQDIPKEPSGASLETCPPHTMRGRGRGQGPLLMRGRGRGRGQFGGPMGLPPPPDTGFHDDSYDHQPPTEGQENYAWVDGSQEQEDQGPHEIWQPEEHHFPEEYYEEEPQEAPEENWQEEQSQEYWEEGDPYWSDRRPPVPLRPPFPHEGPRRPPFHPRFMPYGPRRPPPPGSMEYAPHGPPHINREHMGPRFRRGPGPWGPPPRHEMMRRPPPAHEILERDPMGQPGYPDEMQREPGWPPHPHGREPRHPPLHPREMRRPPMRPPPMPRERWRRPQPPHADSEAVYEEEYGSEFGPEDDRYRRPPPDYRPREYGEDEEYYHQRDEWGRPRPERDFHPHGPPERLREDQWMEERERPLPYEKDDLIRAERRGPNYPDDPLYHDRDLEPPYHTRPDWERPPPPPPPPERRYSHPSEPEPLYEREAEVPPPASSAPDIPLDDSSSVTAKGVLALSQRQHEIILKAAQELKMIRELQESKKALGDPSESAALSSDLPTGLLGLEIPPEVKNALQAGLSSTTQVADYLHTPPAPPPASTLIAKTVDYGHGRDIGTTVERISYGERIVLRPDPLPSDRYEKEPLGRRDPYYDRRSDPYTEPREYGREWERDVIRDRSPLDYDRERYERERFSRDERPPPGAPRSGYRDRERDIRDHGGRSSRDREVYNRPGYDRSSYERSLERYDHGPSGYGNERRSYPEERPPPVASLPPPPPAVVPPRVEKKPETKNVEDILKHPGRASRPDRIVVIMRGLPGSGKSHLAKLIRDKEVECGGAPPRVLGLDDYFMTEVEKEEKDPDTGKRVRTKVLEYEYEPEMEDTYRSSMLKTFKKTLDDGFFPFIIIDAINDKVKYFDQFWSAAKTKGFEVYVAEVTADHHLCSKRNIHGRKLKDITKLANGWESAPVHMARLDIRSLLQDAAIEEVEMEDFNPLELEAQAEEKKEEEEELELGYLPKSKWEMDTSEAKLDKLDGLMGGGKRKRDSDVSGGLEDFLQLPDDYASRMSEPGKKRVRWADLEEQKDADRKRAIGFVVGQTDWEKITDETGQLAQRALNRTKYF